jgi:hypothetical protein
VSVNGTQVEGKMRKFKGECAQFSFNRCPIHTHDGANAKFSTNSQETDNSVDLESTGVHVLVHKHMPCIFIIREWLSVRYEDSHWVWFIPALCTVQGNMGAGGMREWGGGEGED